MIPKNIRPEKLLLKMSQVDLHAILRPLDLEAKDAGAFIADTIDLRVAQAVPALRRMRARLKRPEKTPETLLLDMEKIGLTLTADALRDHIGSL